MEARLDERDYQMITDRVLQQIEKKYALVPKGQQVQQFDEWVGIKAFTNKLPVGKDKEWVRLFILPLPAFKNWVINLNAGQGRPVRINLTKALPWIMDHKDEIDWNRSLPR
ncbi:hypothetical protein [Limosilactobacillus caviae]|uniref:hypothetical protein n=1 Tax=Limosilactobacillus caviae TaxID=1769424 RepID=UPI003518193A